MKTEKKFFLDGGDDVRDILKELKKTSSDRVILHVPEGADIGEDIQNFHKIREAASKLKKEVVIESVDEIILEHAQAARILAHNPVFRGEERTAVSDILPTPKKGSNRARILERIEQKQKKTGVPEPSEPEEDFEEEEVYEEESPVVVKSFTEKRKQKPMRKVRHMRRPSVRLSRRGLYISGSVVTGLVLLGVILFYTLPHADIILTMKKTSVGVEDTILVTTEETTSSVSSGVITIPGELLSAKKNFAMQFGATGKNLVEEKARGILTVYNDFSSSPQRLVATTRFESPDGKIFRTPEAVVIPGAKVSGDVLTPSSIDIEVVADKAGEEYNLPGGLEWTIPGFAGTSRFAGFYAENKESMSGGFSGEKLYPSGEEIELAKATAETSLESNLKTELATLMSDEFSLLDKAVRFKITTQEVQEDKTNPGTFFVYTEGEMQYLIFRKDALYNGILEKAQDALPADAADVVPVDFGVTYEEPESVDFEEGIMEFSAEGTVVFAAAVDTEQLAQNLGGLDESALRREIFAVPGLENGKISLWPFWVSEVPDDPDDVSITVE